MINAVSVTPVGWQHGAILFLAFSALLLLPGLLITWLFLDRRALSWPVRLPAAMALGIGLAITLATLVLILDIPIASLLGLLIAFDIGATAALLLRRRNRREETKRQPSAAEPAINYLFVAIALIVTAWIFYRFAMPTDRFTNRLNFRADFWTYAAQIRKWTTWGARPQVHALLGVPQEGFRFIFGGWMLVQSLFSLLTGIDPIDISAWWIPPFLMIAAYLGQYALAKTLFRNRNTALLATMAFALNLAISGGTDDRIQFTFLWRINEDKFLAPFVLLPMAILFAFRYLREKGKGDLACFLFLTLALPLTHPLGLVEAVLSLGLFSLVHLFYERKWEAVGRLARVLVPLTLLLVVPFVQQRLVERPTAVQGEEAQERFEKLHLNHLLMLDEERNRYITHPVLIQSPLIMAAILLTPLLLVYGKRDWGARFLFANMAGMLFLLYNPILTPLFGRLVTPWMLWRLTYMLPATLVIGFFLGEVFAVLEARLKGLGDFGRPLGALGPVALLCLVAGLLQQQGVLQWPERLLSQPYKAETSLLLQMRSLITEPTRIMCAEPFNTLLPSFVPQGYVVAARDSELHQERQKDANRFLSARDYDSETWEILAEYGCDYVIGDKGRMPALFWVSPLLSKAAENQQQVVWRVAHVPADHPLLQSNTYFAAGEWKEALAANERARAEHPLIADLRRAEIAAKQGDVVQARLLLDEATDDHAGNPWPYLVRAEMELLEGNPDVAWESYQTALILRADDPLFPDYVADRLVRDLARITTVPAEEHARWGVWVDKTYGDIAPSQVRRLRIGWYVSGEIEKAPRFLIEAEHVQTVPISADAYPPDAEVIETTITNHPGSIWLIGMWPEAPGLGNRTPDEYAQIYHEMRALLKGLDPQALVFPGGIVQPTPLRLAWLDAVLATYKERYRTRMPTDGWHINTLILPEDASGAGAGIPAGVSEGAATAYGVTDAASIKILQAHIVAFRQWMADHGERGKPLILSGFGVSAAPSVLGGGDVRAGDAMVLDYMISGFDYLASARSATLGYPADDNRLVQRWLWHGLYDAAYDPATGTGYAGVLFLPRDPANSNTMTGFGQAFATYMESIE